MPCRVGPQQGIYRNQADVENVPPAQQTDDTAENERQRQCQNRQVGRVQKSKIQSHFSHPTISKMM